MGIKIILELLFYFNNLFVKNCKICDITLGKGGLIIVTNCDKDGGGVKKSWNSCDVIYGWPLISNYFMTSSSHSPSFHFFSHTAKGMISFFRRTTGYTRMYKRCWCFSGNYCSTTFGYLENYRHNWTKHPHGMNRNTDDKLQAKRENIFEKT